MKNKKLWGRLMAVAMCSAMLFTSTVSYATELEQPVQQEQAVEQTEEVVTEEETTKEVADTETQTEVDERPTVEAQTIEFVAGKTVEIPVAMGSGQYKADEVEIWTLDEAGKIADIDRGSFYNAEKGVIEFTMCEYSFWNSVKKGTYTLKIQFVKKNQDNSSSIIYENNDVKVNVKETHQGFEYNAVHFDFDGTKDIVFKFKNAEGDFAIKTIDSVSMEGLDFALDENTIGSICIKDSPNQGYVYDLEKGELIVKADAINQIFKDSGFTKFCENWNYDFKFECTLANGEKMCVGKPNVNLLAEVSFKNYNYDLVKDTPTTPEEPAKPSAPKHEVILPAGNTSVAKDVMQSYVEKNKTHDVVIKTPSGVTFTFPKNSMSLVDGKEVYDFGTQLITDYAQAGNTPFSKDDFAFRINYNYSGKLPGNAKISIPLGKDSKWVGKTLYYYEILADGTSKYLTSAKVDANGIFTITQNHCSDYVATPVAPQREETTPSEEAPNSDVPKTGDTSSALPYMMLGLGACGVLVLRRKFI